MSVALREPEAVPDIAVAKAKRETRVAASREHALLFVGAYLAYAVVGYLVVLEWHIVVGDGVSRLAHAYFVWFNDPPKLAAIGFVWPPLMTLVFLPLAVVKPIATSLLALPLMSATFGAGLVVVLARTLELLGMARPLRYVLVACIALNPMILYYAANGMGEVVYLFLLALALYAFIRWEREQRLQPLVLCAVALTLGVLTRYELIFWVAVVALGVACALLRRRARPVEIEAALLTLLAPVTYGFGLWLFFNWIILGDPLWWLRAEVTQTFVETRRVETEATHLALLESFERTLRLTWSLFPATFLVTVGLVVRAFWRRDVVAGVLAASLLLNPLTTAVLGATQQTDVVFQLRYNIRVIPVVLIGLGWLWYVTRSQRFRLAVAAASVLLLAGSVPSMWNLMQTHEQQALEQAFTRAITRLEDQEGRRSLGIGVPVGNGPEREAARWIGQHVRAENSILADDALSFAVILFTGRPDLFVDRTDEGDRRWYEVRDAPQGRVQYMLVSSQGVDRILIRYPGLTDGAEPWARRVFANDRWTIVRVARPE